jgi:polar amino acid transport system substrate-binding protein
MRRLIAVLAAFTLSLGMLTACSPGSSQSTSADNAKTVDAYLSALIPKKYQGATIQVATDATLAPNAFVDPETQQLVGADIDLINAAADVLKIKVTFVNVPFEKVISGVTKGTYPVGASSIVATRAREEKMDLVSYLKSSPRFFVAKGDAFTKATALCGKTVAVAAGGVYVDELKKLSATCPKTTPITIEQSTDQSAATQAVIDGKAYASVASGPVATWTVKESEGKLELAGEPLAPFTYGFAIAKKSGLAPAFLTAVNSLITQGEYTDILKKWGLEDSAVKASTINPRTRKKTS